MKPTPIMRAVATRFGISVEALFSHVRDPKYAIARHVAHFLERDRGLSSPAVAQLYDRDHSTILLACKVVAERVAAGDPRYVNPLTEVRKALVPLVSVTAFEETKQIKGVLACGECPTCGTNVAELRQAIFDINEKLDLLLRVEVKESHGERNRTANGAASDGGSVDEAGRDGVLSGGDGE